MALRTLNPCKFAQSPIEDLPPEIRRLILDMMPEVSSLSALVHASPSFHGTYRVYHAETLFHVLCN